MTSSTAADLGSRGREPRSGRVADLGPISRDDRIGRRPGFDTLRRHQPGDEPVGVAEETALPGQVMTERDHERWIVARDEAP